LPKSLRKTVALVCLFNFAYFFVEFSVATGIGSVSLFATASTSWRTAREEHRSIDTD
jgi:hypothetical protein